MRTVSNTVLLTTISNRAEAKRLVVGPEVPEHRPVRGMLVSSPHTTRLRPDRIKAAAAGVVRALAGLAQLAGALRRPGDRLERRARAVAGGLGRPRAELLVAVGQAATQRETVVVTAVDELRDVPETQRAALM